MPPEISFRLAKEEDFVEISKLVFALFPHASLENTDKDVYFVAVKENIFVGFAPVLYPKNRQNQRQ